MAASHSALSDSRSLAKTDVQARQDRAGGAWKTDFSNAKVLVAALQAGNAFRIRFGGGG